MKFPSLYLKFLLINRGFKFCIKSNPWSIVHLGNFLPIFFYFYFHDFNITCVDTIHSGLLWRWPNLTLNWIWRVTRRASYSSPIIHANVSLESYWHNKGKTLENLETISHSAPTRRAKVTSIREKSVTLKARLQKS